MQKLRLKFGSNLDHGSTRPRNATASLPVEQSEPTSTGLFSGSSPISSATGTPSGRKKSGLALIREARHQVETATFEAEVVSFFVDAADVLGVPKSVAAIYGICFATVEPLSFADIAERLDISDGSISQGIRILREIRALRIVGTRDRREYFAPNLELRKLAAHFVEERLEKQLRAGRGKLDAMKAAVPSRNDEAASELQARIKYLRNWHNKGRALVPVVKAFLKLT